MATSRNRTSTRTALTLNLDGADIYGRLSIDGVRNDVPARRVRKVATYDRLFIHRPKNGVYDPITYYHVLDILMRVTPGVEFRTAEFVKQLKMSKPQLSWDTTSVGRILTDIAESTFEAHGFTILHATRRWDGTTFDISGHPIARKALFNLMEDIVRLCQDTIEKELEGVVEKRLNSPLLQCPSVMTMAGS